MRYVFYIAYNYIIIYIYLYTSIPGRTSTYENILPVQELLLAAFFLPPSNFYMFLFLHVFADFFETAKKHKTRRNCKQK
jgi:hypothetical protein